MFSVMKCPGKVLYKENIILEFTNSTDRPHA